MSRLAPRKDRTRPKAPAHKGAFAKGQTAQDRKAKADALRAAISKKQDGTA